MHRSRSQCAWGSCETGYLCPALLSRPDFRDLAHCRNSFWGNVRTRSYDVGNIHVVGFGVADVQERRDHSVPQRAALENMRNISQGADGADG